MTPSIYPSPEPSRSRAHVDGGEAQDRPTEQASPITVSVVGSSIVRGVAELVDQGDEFEATGYVYPGYTARQINGHIRDVSETQVTVVQAGTNNVESQTVDQCTEELRQLIDNVTKKRRTTHVIMACVPHRRNNTYLNKKIDQINDYIRQEVQKRPNWRLLQHELVSADYKRDNLHLNKRGTVKFAFEVRHIVRNLKNCINAARVSV